jgi:CRP-like cAMP-binding protein
MAQRAEPASARQNRLLAVLPAADLARLEPHLEPVTLPLGTPVYEAGERKTMLYFISSGIVSLLQGMKNGATAEIAIVGDEGVVGISMFMGSHSAPWRAVVQSEVSALRLPSAVLEREFSHGGPLHDLLLRYTQSLIAQMSQTAICNRHHTIEQQFCRWLLLSLDRLPSNELLMTQELMANMLGVRRAGITAAARKLQDARVIRYVRGRITVLDRPTLEDEACECYEVLKKDTDRLFADLRAYLSGTPGSAQSVA